MSRTVTIKDLAIECDRSVRQIKRYLDVPTLAGFDLDADENGNLTGRIRLCGERGSPNPLELITLTRADLIHFYPLASGIRQTGDRPPVIYHFIC